MLGVAQFYIIGQHYVPIVFAALQEVASLIAKEQQTLASESARKLSEHMCMLSCDVPQYIYIGCVV